MAAEVSGEGLGEDEWTVLEEELHEALSTGSDDGLRCLPRLSTSKPGCSGIASGHLGVPVHGPCAAVGRAVSSSALPAEQRQTSVAPASREDDPFEAFVTCSYSIPSEPAPEFPRVVRSSSIRRTPSRAGRPASSPRETSGPPPRGRSSDHHAVHFIPATERWRRLSLRSRPVGSGLRNLYASVRSRSVTQMNTDEAVAAFNPIRQRRMESIWRGHRLHSVSEARGELLRISNWVNPGCPGLAQLSCRRIYYLLIRNLTLEDFDRLQDLNLEHGNGRLSLADEELIELDLALRQNRRRSSPNSTFRIMPWYDTQLWYDDSGSSIMGSRGSSSSASSQSSSHDSSDEIEPSRDSPPLSPVLTTMRRSRDYHPAHLMHSRPGSASARKRSPGASRTVIERNTVQCVVGSKQCSSLEQRHCIVCLQDFLDGEKVRTLPCLHMYHRECIDRWLVSNRSCPVCKHDIVSQKSR